MIAFSIPHTFCLSHMPIYLMKILHFPPLQRKAELANTEGLAACIIETVLLS